MKNVNLISEKLVEASRLADQLKLVTSSSGNISVRCGLNEFLISGTGKSLGRLTLEDISVCYIDDPEKFTGVRPSIENHFHRAIYRSRPDINAVLHFQSLYATIIACSANPDFNLNFIPESAVYLKTIEIVPYYMPGSPELADHIARLSYKTDIYLLKNHGQIAAGVDLDDVIRKASIFEFACNIKYLAPDRLIYLTKNEIDDLAASYG